MLIAPFKTAARPLIRDLVVYLWACYWMFQCLYEGKMELFDAIGLLVTGSQSHFFYLFEDTESLIEIKMI